MSMSALCAVCSMFKIERFKICTSLEQVHSRTVERWKSRAEARAHTLMRESKREENRGRMIKNKKKRNKKLNIIGFEKETPGTRCNWLLAHEP